MSSSNPSTAGRPLDVEFRRLRLHWRQGVDALLHSRALAWLNPVQHVLLRRADGRRQLWLVRGSSASPAPAAAAGPLPAAPFAAIELPAERYLRRATVLPALPPDELAAAVELDIVSASPFATDQLQWAYRVRPGEGATTQVEAVLTSRQQIEPWLAAETAGAAGPAPEIWAVDGLAEPIVLRGHGEALRERAAARARALHTGLLALAAVLLLALALSPTLQLRARALAAGSAYESLNARAAPVLAQREQLGAQAERLATVRQFAGAQASPSRVIEVLSASIPDHAWLTSLVLNGLRVVITGQADNAADLMRTLEGIPGVHDVKATAPATRQPGSGQESFSIGFELDARQFGALAPEEPRPS
ncbi:PilN domain-containing protein [Ottowia sp.]|jgi:general secretion pathway protein L|uniref:PilN domain-containing protein n=1 Tax=Ottowia sp. TaxID=1898956 RepID=UPI002CFE77D2|nr:PilN domain-containing protein [Ottowia sp.]HRN75292.1 PilN domain-containing protein [Ottowia sp.]HRQ02490.1 PilN domain-containing protein [Ottowia sp.]